MQWAHRRRCLAGAALVVLSASCALSHERAADAFDDGLAPECSGPYVLLDAPARRTTVPTERLRCDRLTSVTSATGRVVEPVPDDYVGAGWYRFGGEAGTSIPLEPPEQGHCGGDATGWMTEPPPSIDEGVVEREVCFRFFHDECLWRTPIRVVHCDEFLLFELTDTPQCHLRYCGTDLDVSRHR